MNHVCLRPAPLLNRWKPHRLPAGGEREAQTPFPAHWLWTPGRGQDTAPDCARTSRGEGPAPHSRMPAVTQPLLDQLPGAQLWQTLCAHEGHVVAWVLPIWQFMACHLRTDMSQLTPPLQFLGLTASVHVP